MPISLSNASHLTFPGPVDICRRSRGVTKTRSVLAAGMLGFGLLSSETQADPPINPLFFGQNAWMPDKIGAEEPDGDLETLLCGAHYSSPTDLCVPAEVKESGVKLMRYGGSTVDKNYCDPADPSMCSVEKEQYLTMAKNMKANAIRPLLQVPYFDGVFTEGQAGELVDFINGTHGQAVKHWTIGNEPDKYDGLKSLSKTAIAEGIADYFKRFAVEMRASDPDIVIVGPDLASFDRDILRELTDINKPLSDLCGGFQVNPPHGKWHPYLDILSVHVYPFTGGQSPDEVITRPKNFEENVMYLKELVIACNGAHSRTGKDQLKMAVTEINLEYRPDGLILEDLDLSPEGTSTMSFLAGQYWAEIMSVGMKHGLEFINFWSVKEGDELGYIASDGTKLSTYYHFQMVSTNFCGRYAAGDWDEDAYPNLKAFGARKSRQIVVMLLNQGSSETPLDYTVRLDNGLFVGPGAGVKINIDAGVSLEYSGTIDAQSTVMLLFDAATGASPSSYVYDLGKAQAHTGPSPAPPVRC